MSFLCSILAVFLFGTEVSSSTNNPEQQNSQIGKISEAFGHLIGRNIETMDFQFDIAHLIKGLQDAAAGKEAPMTEAECVDAIAAAQECAFKEKAKENLEKADLFLTKNAQEEGITSLKEGKVQYKIEQEGTGASVEEHFSPLIRYTAKFLDGTVFGASKEDELICLDETIAGFSSGLLGMKEGEKRTIYIHPDLGYGTSSYLPPNSLLTFEVEIVKADAPNSDENVSIHPQSTVDIGLPSKDSEIVR